MTLSTSAICFFIFANLERIVLYHTFPGLLSMAIEWPRTLSTPEITPDHQFRLAVVGWILNKIPDLQGTLSDSISIPAYFLEDHPDGTLAGRK